MFRGKSKTILLVEDETIIGMSQKMSLESYGYRVLLANTGEQAIETVNSTNEIDLILMDIDLGDGIDGTTAASTILKDNDLPIVFVSSHMEPEIVAKTENITSYGYVVKSSSTTVLDASIKMAFKLFEANQSIIEREQKEYLFASVVENSNDMVVVKDLNRRIISCNEKFINSTASKSLKDLIGKTDADILGISEDEEPVHSYMIDDLKALQLPPGESVIVEEKIPSEDGLMRTFMTKKFPISIGSNVIGLGVITTDITKQRDVTEKIKSQHTLLATIMETSPIGVTLVDHNGCITFANNRAEQILGIEKKEITGRVYNAPEWKNVDLDGRRLPDEQLPFNLVKKTGETVYSIQYGLNWPDGKLIFLSVNASPLQDEDGMFSGMVATFEDITDKLENEKTIRRQLEEKNILLKEVHHRIKNNIASVEALLTMQLQLITSSEAVSALQDAIARVQGMRILYDKLLINSEYEELAVKTYIETIIDAIAKVFPEHSRITIEKNIADFKLSTQKVFSLGIIINELLTNVFKYSFKGKDNGHLSIVLDEADSLITLSIQDNGYGFVENDVPKKNKGFGLEIIKMLTEQLGGRFTIGSRNGTRSELKFIN